MRITGRVDTIFLEPSIKELPQVTVRKRQGFANEKLGIFAKASSAWGWSGYGEEFAQKIYLAPKNQEYFWIRKVFLTAKRFDPTTPVVLHVYSVHPQSGIPEQELLSKKYLLSKKHFKNGIIAVDIEDENLIINDSCIYVAIEWLGYGENKTNDRSGRTILSMTNEVDEPLTYSRTLAHASFNWFMIPTIGGKTTNTIFFVEINKLK